MAIYSVWKVRRKGKIHGRDWKWSFWPLFKTDKPVIPPDDCKQITDYENSIKNAAEKDIREIEGNYKKKDAKLKVQYCNLKEKKKKLEDELPKESDEQKDAKTKLDEIKEELFNLGRPGLSGWVAKLIILLLILAEFPLNAIVFSIFGERKLLTYLMAAVIGIGIPIGAHVVGMVLKQRVKTRSDITMATVIIFIVVVVLVGIAFLRADFFSYLLSTHRIGIKISPGKAALIFVALNLFLFCLAAAISYIATHPEHEKYKSLESKLKEAKKKLRLENKDVIRITKQLDEIEDKLRKVQEKRKSLYEECIERMNTKKELAETLIDIYRSSNVENRPSGVRPPCFNKKISIDVPQITFNDNCQDQESKT